MTDNEIIELLERMITDYPNGILAEILDLINRQKAEIWKLKSKVKLSSIYGLTASMLTHKDCEMYVKNMTEEDKNKLLQCVIDFGYVDTDNVKQLTLPQTIINKLGGETK